MELALLHPAHYITFHHLLGGSSSLFLLCWQNNPMWAVSLTFKTLPDAVGWLIDQIKRSPAVHSTFFNNEPKPNRENKYLDRFASLTVASLLAQTPEQSHGVPNFSHVINVTEAKKQMSSWLKR